MRIEHAFSQSELPLADFLQEEFANFLFTEFAGRIVPDALFGEQVRQVVPQAEFGIMPIGVLQALHGANGFRRLQVRFEAVYVLLKHIQSALSSGIAAEEQHRTQRQRIEAGFHAGDCTTIIADV